MTPQKNKRSSQQVPEQVQELTKSISLKLHGIKCFPRVDLRVFGYVIPYYNAILYSASNDTNFCLVPFWPSTARHYSSCHFCQETLNMM